LAAGKKSISAKVKLKEGYNKIRFTSQDLNVKLDYFLIEPVE
jgi:hypothetical protein